MIKDTLSIVIVGHVDHGKSTLIGRLLFDTNSLPQDKMEEAAKAARTLGKGFELAFLIDQLKEEREGELTIDTTQAFFKTRKRRYVIIDAPGHTEFIKNMITGASQAEAAVLIVSAEKSLEEQTKRHAYILWLLGIQQVIVVINKMDVVAYNQARFAEVSRNVSDFLHKIGLSASHNIPISAKIGGGVTKPDKNMRWHNGPTLVGALDAVDPQKKATKQSLRFPVQDVYVFGSETLFVGKIASGIMKRGQPVMLLPQYEASKIECIKVFEGKRSQALEGDNVGITLTRSTQVKRGDLVCQKEDVPAMRKTFKGNIFWMAQEPLHIRKAFTLRCATQEVECSVTSIEKRLNSSTLEEITGDLGILTQNEVGVVVFEAAAPIVVEKFAEVKELGRFVLESDGVLVGSGTTT